MGAVAPDSVLVQSGFVTEAEQEVLKAKGAVGDILSRYIDAHGRIVDPDLDSRTIGLDLRFARSVNSPSASRQANRNAPSRSPACAPATSTCSSPMSEPRYSFWTTPITDE